MRDVRATARRQRGVTSIEYALIGALISVAIVVSVSSAGGQIARFYDYVAGLVGCAAQSGGSC